MKIKGLVFADLHIGVMNLTQQYREIENVLFASIKKYKPDFIISLGDFFDHKASLNDSLSYYSFLVFTKIISICDYVLMNKVVGKNSDIVKNIPNDVADNIIIDDIMSKVNGTGGK